MYRMCVADHDLFSQSTPRQFLCGIATFLNEPVCITPRIVSQTTNTVRYVEAQRVLDSMNRSGIQDRKLLARVLIGVEAAVREWVDEVFMSGEGVVRCVGRDPESRVEVLEWASKLPRQHFKRLDRSGFNNDLLIVAESIASGAELVFSNNMGTIDQFQLNQWLLDMGVRNRPLIQNGDIGMSQLLNHDLAEFSHRSAICMTLLHESRCVDEEAQRLQFFASRLRQSFALCANAIEMEEVRSEQRGERWKESRHAIETTQWKTARIIETLRIDKVRKAVQEEGFDL